MSQQQDTLAQLNAARDQLTPFIIQTTAVQGTPEWTKLERVVQERDSLTLQINEALNANFPNPTADLNTAVATLQKNTQALTSLNKTLGTIDQIIAVADTIVQVGASILAIVAA